MRARRVRHVGGEVVDGVARELRARLLPARRHLEEKRNWRASLYPPKVAALMSTDAYLRVGGQKKDIHVDTETYIRNYVLSQ